ncbi:VCBS repeat-containing protein [Fulvivirgaceae bacterium BMA10]|uniref:VCBS repeat-containing protein n=1 Tax=Splendidivirga corallicola TaxID=3051826 RepID=A0ABT8KXJ1_9BACT|nr:VCBS repeat-containing protein [Fulvivirgaceae bacterium BMA10]
MKRINFYINPDWPQIFSAMLYTTISLLILITAGCIDDQSNPNPPDPIVEGLFTNVTGTHLNSNGTGANSMDAQVIDLEADGDLDVILAMEFRPNIILINDGSGVLNDESSTRFPSANHDSEDIAAADFDGDGDIDILFVSEDDQVNEFYRNRGDGTFVSDGDVMPVLGTSNAVETVDIDGDQDYDVLIGNAGQNVILINDGKAGFTDETTARWPANTATTQDIELGDVDGDGDLDILEANETFNRLLINDGNGFFTDETSDRLPQVNDQTREADFGDIDKDGDLDILFANVDFGGFGDPQNRLLLNNGQGNFTEVTSERLPVSDFRTVDADFVDINGDGYPDILSGNRFNGAEMIVLLNDGEANFSDQTETYLPNVNMYPFDFQVADFNNDGKEDIYICGFRGNDALFFGK